MLCFFCLNVFCREIHSYGQKQREIKKHMKLSIKWSMESQSDRDRKNHTQPAMLKHLSASADTPTVYREKIVLS